MGNIPEGWHLRPIGDVLTLQRGFDITKATQRAGDVPVVSSGGVGSYHDTAAATGPGVVIGRKGTLGKVFFINDDYWPHDTTLWVTDFKGSEPRFVYYFFQTLRLEQHDVGSSNPTLNRNHVHPIVVPWPCVHEQKAIAEVLGALDDKIALNEQHAQTALELADSLYQRESAEHDCWSESALKDTAKWLSGGTPRTSEPSYWGGDIPWISAASLKTPWLYDSERSVTELGAQNGTRLVPKGSILFVVRGMSLTTEFRVGVAQREVAFGQDCKALIPYLGIDSATLFLAVRAQSAAILGLVDLAGHGTGRLVTERVANLRVRLPQGDDAVEFAARAGALMARAVAVRNENRTLANLRDTLLPQLLSGALRVKDAVRTVEEAV
ncbi:restriction endonuclease subunit S [Streptomyces sp. NPDC008313]|uniref:restriction endonuclease subunit S n=1 Tax=Streptomyces sp. NPDC008313 TaxID=3364826 RepID=UPI0036E0DD49